MQKSPMYDPAALPHTDWNSIPWNKLSKYVRKLQQRIYRAEQLGNRRKVKSLQRLLMRSKAALLLSIRQVTQLNKGKRTEGVDGFKVSTPEERMKLYYKLEKYSVFHHNPSPTKRVYIPKDIHKTKLRPLGIPIIIDRVFQNVVKLALEPQWEQRFDPKSYGFRPKRSIHDAIGSIYRTLRPNKKRKWIFEGDFKGCFDNLNHEWIENQIDGFPAKKVIQKWLKAGFIDNNVFEKTESGTPQGGVISPLLAIIALNGMENELGIEYYKAGKDKKTGRQRYTVKGPISLVRYADDFVILCETKSQALSMYKKLEPYLEKRGLELAKDKTKITHVTEGFDFLGFNIKHYPTSEIRGKLYKCIIKPSKKSIQRFVLKVKDCFRRLTGNNVEALIAELLPLIRGTAHSWQHVVSKKIYSKMDSYIFKKIVRFLKRLHPKKNWNWIKQKYFKPDRYGQSNDKWLLTSPHNINYQMIKMAWTPIVRHELIIHDSSPFDSELENYFEERDIKEYENTELIDLKRKLAKKQKFKCTMCGKSIADRSEGTEVHHSIPKIQGGNDKMKNLELVHISCHIRWHKVFPANKVVPNDEQKRAFRKFLYKTKN